MTFLHDIWIIFSRVISYVEGIMKSPVSEFQSLPVVFISGLGLFSYILFLIGGFLYGVFTYFRGLSTDAYERIFEKIIQYQLFALALGIPLIISRITKSSFLVPKETILAFSAGVILSTWVLKMFATRNFLVQKTQLDPLFVAFFLICAIGMLNASSFFLSYHTLIYFCSGLIIFYASVNNLSSLEKIYKVLLVFSYSSACSAIWGIGEFFNWRPFLWSETSGRLAIISSFGNPNYFAGFMVVVLPVALCLSFYKWEKKSENFFPSFFRFPFSYYLVGMGLIAFLIIFTIGGANSEFITVKNTLTFPPTEIQKVGEITTNGDYHKIISAIEKLKSEKKLRHGQSIILEIAKDNRRGRVTVRYFNFSLGLVYFVSFLIFILLPVLFLLYKRIFASVAFCIIFFGLQISQTRGAILAFFSGLGFFILFTLVNWYKNSKSRNSSIKTVEEISNIESEESKKSDKNIIYAVTIGCMIFVILLLALIPSPVNNYQNLLSRFKSDYTLYQRLMVWNSTILMAATHPIVGIGIGNFKYHYLDFQAKFINNKDFFIPYNGKAIQTHNEYLQVLAENGIVGLSLFLLAIFVFYYRAFNLFNQLNGNSKVLFVGTMISVTGVLMHAVVSFPFHLSFSSTAFVIMLGMNFCISKIRYSGIEPEIDYGHSNKSPNYFGIIVSLVLIFILSYVALKPFVTSYHWKQGLVNGMKGSMKDISRHAEFVRSGMSETQYRDKALNNAISSFSKAISYLPDDGELYVGRADIYARLAIKSPPKNASKEVLLKAEKDRNDALLQARKNYLLGMKNFKDRELYNDLANVLVRLKKDEEAVEIFEKTVWYAPDFLMARNNYALMLYRMARKVGNDPAQQAKVAEYLSTAALQMEKIIHFTIKKKRPVNNQLVLSLFSMYQALIEMASRSYNTELAKFKDKYADPESKKILFDHSYGSLLERIFKVNSQVLGYWEKDMIKSKNRRYAEDCSKLMINTFYIVCKTGLAPVGIKKMEKYLLDFDPFLTGVQKAKSLQAIGVEYGKMKNYQGSIDVLQRACEYNPRDATIYSDLGVAYGFMNKIDRSIEIFEKAHGLFPESASIGNNLGLAYFKTGKLGKALMVANKIKSKAKGLELKRVNQLIAEINKYRKKK
ncbi:O-antigen ligase family protein [bacterium]|nr:O-antigen ligase family protein [bacterium]